MGEMNSTEEKPSYCPCSLLNCLTSSSLLCYICCQGCRISKVRNGFIFLPPSSSYKLVLCDKVDRREANQESTSLPSTALPNFKLLYTIEELATIPAYVEAARSARAYEKKTSRGQTIYLTHMPPYSEKAVFMKPEERHRPVIIHCHGNATDMGLMMLAYIDLATTLNADVVGVEYTGFGVSSGQADYRDIDADIEAAYDFVLKDMQVDPKDIILYGQSVGSAPVMSLAAKYPVAGAILHSAMLSGIKVLDPEIDKLCRPSQVFWCFDIFPNYKHVKDSDCDIHIIHGQRDDVIPFVHAKRLHNVGHKEGKRRKITSYFPVNSGHNDISELNRNDYYRSIHNFLRYVLKDRAYKYGEGVPSRNSRPALDVVDAPWQMDMGNGTEEGGSDSSENQKQKRAQGGRRVDTDKEGGIAIEVSSSKPRDKRKNKRGSHDSAKRRSDQKDAVLPGISKKKSFEDSVAVVSGEGSRTIRRSQQEQTGAETTRGDADQDDSEKEVGNPQDVCDDGGTDASESAHESDDGTSERQIDMHHLSTKVGPTDGMYEKIRKGSTKKYPP